MLKYLSDQSALGAGKDRKRASRLRLYLRAVLALILIAAFFLHPSFYRHASKAGKVYLAKKQIVLMIISSAAAVILPYFLERRLSALKPPVWIKAAGEILLIFTGFTLALIEAERIHGFNFLTLRPLVILCNFGLVLCFFLVFYVISGRVKISVILTYILIVGFSALNYYVDQFRGEAISAADLYVIRTAVNVAGEYTPVLTKRVFESAFAGFLLYGLLCISPVGGRHPAGLKKWLLTAVLSLAVISGIMYPMLVSDWPTRHNIKVKLFNPMLTYQRNGEALNFMRGFYYLQVQKPKDYSTDAVTKIMEKGGYESDPADLVPEDQQPNVIMIMNESLMDFGAAYKDTITMSEDAMPFIHSLKNKDNAILGWLQVDVFGGRTANSEYTTMTGLPQTFLPAYAVPYALYVRKQTPALAWNMRDMGYSGDQALHPYYANGYSRFRAYPLLGFTDFISLETIKDHLTDQDYVRGFVSDSGDYRELIRRYEESQKDGDNPFFLFNVTMQNHGSYEHDYDNFDQSIKLTGDFAQYKEAERYINLVKYSDQAFKELTEYFSKVDRPTIIVMYGDHQPNLGKEFYSTLWGIDPASTLSKKRAAEKYRTRMVVWANYDINPDRKYTRTFRYLSVNYLTAKIMELAGLPKTAFQKYLLDLSGQMPIISERGIYDSDIKFHRYNELEDNYQKMMDDYQTLVYNYQFDEKNRLDQYFTLKGSSFGKE